MQRRLIGSLFFTIMVTAFNMYQNSNFDFNKPFNTWFWRFMIMFGVTFIIHFLGMKWIGRITNKGLEEHK